MDEETKVVELLIAKTEAGEVEWNTPVNEPPIWSSIFGSCRFKSHPHALILWDEDNRATRIEDEVLIIRLRETLIDKYPPASLTEKQRLQNIIDCLEDDKNSN